MPTGIPRASMLSQVLTLIRRRRSTYAEQVARHLNVNIKTARRILSDLTAEGQICPIEGTQSPKMYVMASDSRASRLSDKFPTRSIEGGNVDEPSQTDEIVDESNVGCESPTLGNVMRASSPADIRKVPGFVCSPWVRPYDLDAEFGRGHYAGPVTIEVRRSGSLTETFALPESGVTGGFVVRQMKGNKQIDGHINLPNSPAPYKIKAFTRKDGSVGKILFYPQYRWIRRVPGGTIEACCEEFYRQTLDVLAVLQSGDWQFAGFRINPGSVHYTLENGIAQHVSQPYVWHDGDSIHYDKSLGYAEAEVYGSSSTANDDIDMMVELPDRIRAIESNQDEMQTEIGQIVSCLKTSVAITQGLAESMTAMVKIITPKPAECKPSEDPDIMYGRFYG